MAQMFIYKGKVTRVTTYGVWAEVPALGTDFEFGPLETLKGVTYAIDDRIVVGQLAGVSEDLVALGKVGSGPEIDAYTKVESDARYYTETEVNTLLGGKSNTGHLHDDRYYTETEVDTLLGDKTTQKRLNSVGATATWIRIAYLDGLNTSTGAEISLLISGQGTYEQNARAIDIVTFTQRGVGATGWAAWHYGANTTPWQFYYLQGSDTVFELWAKRSAYDGPVSVQLLSQMNTALLLNGETTVQPAGLVALAIPVNVDQISRSAVTRILHGSSAATARPVWATYVEWVGSVQPTNMTATDTWVNTSL